MILESMIKKKTQEETIFWENWVEKRNAEMPMPEGVRIETDLPYIEDGNPRHLMDVYIPEKAEGKFPVIVNLHGGGLLMGTKELNRQFCARMCKMGFAVFCMDYPIVPDVDIYQVFADVSKGLDKVDALLKTYGGDREHVYLSGDSAGAYIITYLSAMQKSKRLADAAGVAAPKLPIKALGLICGMFYTRKFDEIGIFMTEWIYGKNWKKHPFRPYMNPEHEQVVKNLPPCYLVTAGGDNLRKYTLEYYKALEKNGMPCQLTDFSESKHLEHAFCALYPELEESMQANEQMAAFFRKY